jgi:hypothetical protein
MRPSLVLTACLASVLCGCAGAGWDLHEGLKKSVGQNVQSVIDDLGRPTSQQKLLGDTVYVWNTDLGAVAFEGGWVHRYCNVQVTAGRDGRVKSYDYSGEMEGCQRWAALLDR